MKITPIGKVTMEIPSFKILKDKKKEGPMHTKTFLFTRLLINDVPKARVLIRMVAIACIAVLMLSSASMAQSVTLTSTLNINNLGAEVGYPDGFSP